MFIKIIVVYCGNRKKYIKTVCNQNVVFFFYVLLTVHLSIILAIDQLNAQILV